ncbi:hypothetical protein NIES2119_28200 [[Phormidium ambiguum] IAM M-71]|uniref:histidine kinase n=1 Tax=[Phormidium ambiguum] IAM M-71 TaxID=454136 RepID=A0A1U7I5U1_9CYAN|nr:HAMP domain-containing histidine kinase [Phormidium ambiguum]OKH31613.1 hypothetical protein NIES2119_28200 [Phormidium ambiguum IAM M-71]
MPSPLTLFLQRFSLYPAKIPLRWLLVIPFVLQTVGTTALVGYLSYRSGQQAVENLANQLLRQTSERVNDRLSSYLQPSQLVVASNYFMVKQGILNLNNQEQLRQQLWQQINSNPSIPTTGFWSDRGNALTYVRISTEQEKILAEQITGKPTPIGTIYLNEISANQRRYYQVDSQGKPQKLVYKFNDDFRKLAWYRRAKIRNRQHWIPVFVGRISAKLETMTVAPVYNADRSFQGFFTANYFLFNFSTFLNQLHFSRNGQVFIIDRSGNLIATSVLSERSAMRLVNGKPTRLPAVNSQDELTRKVAQQLLTKFGSFHNLKNVKQLNLTFNHQRNFVQVTPYKDKYGLDWLVVMVIPESDFMAQIHSNSRTTVLLCLLVLGLSIASGIAIASAFTSRITRLNKISQKLADGDLTQRLPIDSSIVEVQKLAHSFNLMAEQLQQLFQRQVETEATRLSEAYFQKLAGAIPGMIYTYSQYVDGSQAFEYVSSFCRDILELEPEQIIADANIALNQIHSEDRLAHYAAVQHSFVTLKPFNFTFRNITPSGKLKWLEANSRPLRNDNGTVTWYGILFDITDRKQAEIALQRYERIVSATIDGIVLIDRNYRYQIVNQTYCQWHKKSIDEIIGHSIAEILGEEVFQTVIKPRIDCCLQGETIEYTKWLTLPGMGAQFFSVTYIPYLNTDASISGVVASLRNITPLKLAEIALRQSEQKFRGAFDTISAGMALVSPAGGFLEVNAALCKIFKYSEEELLKLRFEDIEHPDDRYTDVDWIKPIFSGKISAYQVEKRFLTKQGQIIWGLMNLALMRDAQANPLYLIVQIADITDRKQAEIAREESEARLRLALEVSGAIAWERDLETDEMLFTKTVLSEIPKKVSYLQAMAQVHPEDREALHEANQKAIAQCGTFQIEHRVAVSLEKPEWRWFQVSARVLTDARGKPVRLIGMSVDITDRHQLDTMKNEFISMVSHELRTPLTSISGSLCLLESGVLKNKPQVAQQMLEIGVKNTQRLVRLVNDILDLQRLESGKMPLVKEVCQVNDLFEQAVESVQTIANQGEVTLEFTPLNVSVRASPDEIIQTLINLVGNAIKFSPPRSTIWLKAEVINNFDRRIRHQFPDLENNISSSYILFSITDQGRGIPAEKLDSIFGRFQQVDILDSRQKGGTGLGLAICKNIVQRHQGEIWVQSAIGQGSTFYFTLPMED